MPILLGSFLVAARVPGADRLYGIVTVVVVFSLVMQGSLVPAARLRRGHSGCSCAMSPSSGSSARFSTVWPPAAESGLIVSRCTEVLGQFHRAGRPARRDHK